VYAKYELLRILYSFVFQI